MTNTTKTETRCVDPASRKTRALLGYGVIVGPIYVVVSLIQAFTRQGFDLARHPASILANGGPGWIQVSNLIVAGAMTVAAAVGLQRVLRGRVGATWGPRLVGAYGISLAGAGVFRADPTDGFPIGTPDGPGPVSWHGLLHLAVGAVGFLALVAACLVIGGGFAATGERGWATYSRFTGVMFLLGFLGIAAGSGAHPATVLGFWVAVILAWGWLSALSAHFYRLTDRRDTTDHPEPGGQQ
jgi:hypothetical protein